MRTPTSPISFATRKVKEFSNFVQTSETIWKVFPISSISNSPRQQKLSWRLLENVPQLLFRVFFVFPRKISWKSQTKAIPVTFNQQVHARKSRGKFQWRHTSSSQINFKLSLTHKRVLCDIYMKLARLLILCNCSLGYGKTISYEKCFIENQFHCYLNVNASFTLESGFH